MSTIRIPYTARLRPVFHADGAMSEIRPEFSVVDVEIPDYCSDQERDRIVDEARQMIRRSLEPDETFHPGCRVCHRPVDSAAYAMCASCRQEHITRFKRQPNGTRGIRL